MDATDRRMFAPMLRADPQSAEAQICVVLGRFEPGATPARLVNELFRLRLVIGTKAPVIQRISDLLQDMERAERVERTADGRYRVVKTPLRRHP
jgi:hypothetical protein